MNDCEAMLKSYGLHALPPMLTAQEACNLIVARRRAMHPHYPMPAANGMCRAMRALGFEPAGKVRSGAQVFFNPHHGNGPVI